MLVASDEECWRHVLKFNFSQCFRNIQTLSVTLVMMSSQAVYRAGLVAPLLGSGSVITTSSEERELARSISVRRRCLQIFLTRETNESF